MSVCAACASLSHKNRLPTSSGSAGPMATLPLFSDTVAMARDAVSLSAPGVKMACAFMTDLLRTGFHNLRRLANFLKKTVHGALGISAAVCKAFRKVMVSLFSRLFEHIRLPAQYRLSRRCGLVQAPAGRQVRGRREAL